MKYFSYLIHKLCYHNAWLITLPTRAGYTVVGWVIRLANGRDSSLNYTVRAITSKYKVRSELTAHVAVGLAIHQLKCLCGLEEESGSMDRVRDQMYLDYATYRQWHSVLQDPRQINTVVRYMRDVGELSETQYQAVQNPDHEVWTKVNTALADLDMPPIVPNP
jgi:hypothetical protein